MFKNGVWILEQVTVNIYRNNREFALYESKERNFSFATHTFYYFKIKFK